jgi:Alcohol dehydrogenase, class IV
MQSPYFMPTKVYIGNDCVFHHASVFSGIGKKALIVTGNSSAKKNGSLFDITTVLNSQKIAYSVYDKVMSNPTIECVYEGAKFCNDELCDFVIAIGGGSPMDAAKAIALLAVNEIPEEELFSGSYGDKILPTVFVPTTAGTGSEVTQYSILMNDKLKTKTSIASPLLFPKIALLDGKYCENLPLKTTINTTIDALSHSIEGMLSNRTNSITDLLAKEALKTIANCFPAIKNQQLSPEQREALLYASALGGMVIANTGTTAVHAMGYSLTYFKDIDHGRANGLLLCPFLRLAQEACGERVKEVLSCMGYKSINELETTLNILLGKKETLTEEEVEYFSGIAIKSKNISNCLYTPTQDEIKTVYRSFMK